MVTARARSATQYDVHIEHDASGSNVKQGFILAKDGETDLLAYRPGTAPLLAPQFRSSGFTYAHRPPEIDLPLSFNDWSGGAGFRDAEAAAGGSVGRYNYSVGVDASFEKALYPSPSPSNAGTSISGLAIMFLHSDEHGTFLISQSTLYEKTATSTMTSRQAATANSFYTDLVEYSNATDTYLLAAQGGGSTPANYRVSTDGTTWTQATGTNADTFIAFAVRTTAAGDAVIWGITHDGALSNTQDPSSTGAWTAADQITQQATESVRDMVTGPDNKLYVFTSHRVYRYDGTTIELFYEHGNPSGDETSIVSREAPRVAVLGPDNAFYVRHWFQVLRMDPVNDTVSVAWPRSGGQSTDSVGEITAITATDRHVFFESDAAPGNLMMKGLGTTWHSIISETQFRGLTALPPGANGTQWLTTTQISLAYVTTSNTARYVRMPRQGYEPQDDANYVFKTDPGTIYGPWVDFGAQTFKKLVTEAELVAENIASIETATLKIELEDNQGTETTLITANAAGFLYTGAASTTLEFTRMRYVLELDYTSGDPPIVRGFALHAAPIPPRKRTWGLDVLLGAPQRGGGRSRYSVTNQEAFLFDGLNERITFYDRTNTTYTARLLDIQYAGIRQFQGQDHPVLSLSLVEL